MRPPPSQALQEAPITQHAFDEVAFEVDRVHLPDPQVVLADEPTGNLDSAATLDVLQLFKQLHEYGQTLVIVTHDARIAATADRMFSMRDGALVDETRLTGGTTGNLGALVGLED